METMLGFNSLTDPDGFGIINTDGDMFKTSDTAIEFFNLSENRSTVETALKGNFRGIGHCRRATIKNSVKDENAHPFINNGISLMHNGTLTKFEWSTEITKLINQHSDGKEWSIIDTEKVTVVLAHFIANNGGKLTRTVLEDCMKFFNGTFNFLINLHNKPGTTYITKGWGRPLCGAVLKDGRNSTVGFILNSRLPQLNLALNIVEKIKGWKYLYIPFKDNTFYSYEYGSYTVMDHGDFVYDSAKKVAPKPVTTPATKSSSPKPGVYTTTRKESPTGIMKKVGDLYDLLIDAGISTVELDIMLCQMFNISLLELDDRIFKEVENMLIVLKEIRNKYFAQCVDLKETLYPSSSQFSAEPSKIIERYNETATAFPYHLDRRVLGD